MPRNPNKQRCSATTADGRRCSKWARRGSEQGEAFCNVHGNGALPEVGQQRCAATTADGRRCPNWAMRATRGGDEEGPTLCNVHAGLTAMPDKVESTVGRRCSATTERGKRCRKWAMVGSSPPLCNSHVAGGGLPGEEAAEAGRRCTAMTLKGERCPNWAMADSVEAYGRPVCGVHAGHFRLPGPGERRCSARTKTGEQCPHWAIRGTEEEYGRLLCAVHVPEGDARKIFSRLPEAGERRCTAKTLDGDRCRHWALLEDEAGQGLCWQHAYPEAHPQIRHGYYMATPPLSDVEWEAIRLGRASERPLDGEIVMARLLMQLVVDYLKSSERPLSEDLNSVRLIIRDVRVVARLLLARKELEEAEEERERRGRTFEGLEQLRARLAQEGQEAVSGEAQKADGESADVDGPGASIDRDEEAVALLETTRAEDLGREIALLRDLLPQVLATVSVAVQGGQELVRPGQLVVRGTRAVADLVQAKEELRPDPGAVWEAAMDRALDELSEEWGIEL